MTVASVQERLLEAGSPEPVHEVCPWTVRLLVGEMLTSVVQAQVPAGMETVVVELVIWLKAACTSEELQLAAVIVCADA